MTVSRAEGGAGLGTVWGAQLALRMLADAGFTDVTVDDVPDDPLDSVYVARPDPLPSSPFVTRRAGRRWRERRTRR